LALGKKALQAGDAIRAQQFFETALTCPENLGEATHLVANQSDILYWLGTAAHVAGDATTAQKWWERAAEHKGDFQAMSVKAFSEMTYYNALALKRLGKTAEAETLLRELLRYANAFAEQPAKIDYFATSLPAMLLFEDDLQKRNTITATFLQAQARLGLGETAKAQELLGAVLLFDRNHALAVDLLSEVSGTHAAPYGTEVIHR
jgi:tetratricopeptide (TPR) repeat protein